MSNNKPLGGNAVLGRGFLRGVFLTATLSAFMLTIGSAESPSKSRSVSFKVAQTVKPDGKIAYYDDDVHTEVYYHDGAYDPKVLKEITNLLRDRAKNETLDDGMDRNLMDLLYEIKTGVEARHPGLNVVFHVISGFRSPETNEDLRTDAKNPFRSAVAQGSMHTHAKAIDIFVPEVSGEELRDTAWCLQQGGVGWYPQFKDKFPYRYIHVDTGRVRHWGFNPATVHCR
jgi:uncharacterized protein YcbK (DUF882 family)